MKRPITEFDRDDEGEWVAVLSCGHRQHVRHKPPFINRPWVTSAEGRSARIGSVLDCVNCKSSPRIAVKRVYDPYERSDGERYLVDRLWPRGIKKSRAKLDGWLKNLAPSPELRQWFGHRGARWHEFAQRYALELKRVEDDMDWLIRRAKRHPVTLVYAARDKKINHAVVLRDHLLHRARDPKASAASKV